MRWWSTQARPTHAGHPAPAPSTVPVCRVGMQYDRPTPPEWQAVLDEVNDVGPNASRLVLRWFAGDAWEPIHRWVIWQVEPWAFVPSAIQALLEGPNPRTDAELVHEPVYHDGHWQSRYREQGPYTSGINYQTWRTYHDLKAEGLRGRPVLFWVLQGEGGGQPYRLSQSARARWAAEGRVHSDAGDGAYVGFDRRVLWAIEPYCLRTYARGVGKAETTLTHTLARRHQADERVTRRLAWDMYQAQLGEWAPYLRHSLRKAGAHYHRHRPVGVKAQWGDVAQYKERFLETLNTELPA